MEFTREEKDAELRRRGLPVKEAFTRAQKNEELMRRGYLPPKGSFENPAEAGQALYQQMIHPLTVGAEKELGDLALGAYQLAGGKGHEPAAQQLQNRYQESVEKHPYLTKGAGLATNIGISAPLALESLIATKALPFLARLGITSGASGLTAGGQSALAYEYPGENRWQKGLESGIYGTLVPFGAGAVGKTLQAGYKYGKRALKPEIVANELLSKTENISKYFNQGFEEMFNRAKQNTGINELYVRPPKFKADSRTRIRRYDKDASVTLNKFRKNPTIENAHDAQKDLGRLERQIKNDIKKHGRSTERNEALTDARKMQQSIIKKINTAFENSGNPGLVNDYKNFRFEYKKNGAPYINNKYINAYKEKQMKARTMVKKISKDEPFMISQEANLPELRYSDIARKAVEAAAKGTAGSLGIGAGAGIAKNLF